MVVICSGPRIPSLQEGTLHYVYFGSVGQPWAAVGLPNGDLVTVGSQSSRRTGHVYVWSADATRVSTDEMLLARFANDMKPPPKPKPSEEGEKSFPQR